MTRVVFRKWRNGDIIALFPDIQETGYKVLVYEHIGQHGVADYTDIVSITLPASPEEYLGLMTELKTIGYKNIKVIKKAKKGFYRCEAGKLDLS